MLLGLTMKELLAPLASWVRAHPTEIIVVEGQVLTGKWDMPSDAQKDLVEFILSTFSGMLYPQEGGVSVGERE